MLVEFVLIIVPVFADVVDELDPYKVKVAAALLTKLVVFKSTVFPSVTCERLNVKSTLSFGEQNNCEPTMVPGAVVEPLATKDAL